MKIHDVIFGVSIELNKIALKGVKDKKIMDCQNELEMIVLFMEDLSLIQKKMQRKEDDKET